MMILIILLSSLFLLYYIYDIDECQDPAVCPDLSKGRVQFSIFVSAKVLLKRDPYLGVYEAN